MNIYLIYQLMRSMNKYRKRQIELGDERDYLQDKLDSVANATDISLILQFGEESLIDKMSLAMDNGATFDSNRFEDALYATAYNISMAQKDKSPKGEAKLAEALEEYERLKVIVDIAKGLDGKKITPKMLEEADKRFMAEFESYGRLADGTRVNPFDAEMFEAKNLISGKKYISQDFMMERGLAIIEQEESGYAFEKYHPGSATNVDYYKNVSSIISSATTAQRNGQWKGLYSTVELIGGVKIDISKDAIKKEFNQASAFSGGSNDYAFASKVDSLNRVYSEKAAEQGLQVNRRALFVKGLEDKGLITKGRFTEEKVVEKYYKRYDNMLIKGVEVAINSSNLTENEKAKFINIVKEHGLDEALQGVNKDKKEEFNKVYTKALSDEEIASIVKMAEDRASAQVMSNFTKELIHTDVKFDKKTKEEYEITRKEVIEISGVFNTGLIFDETGENQFEFESKNAMDVIQTAAKANGLYKTTGSLTIYSEGTTEFLKVAVSPLKGLQFYTGDSAIGLGEPYLDAEGNLQLPKGMRKVTHDEASQFMGDKFSNNPENEIRASIINTNDFELAVSGQILSENDINPNMKAPQITTVTPLTNERKFNESVKDRLDEIRNSTNNLSDAHPHKIVVDRYLTDLENLKEYKDFSDNERLLNSLRNGDIDVTFEEHRDKVIEILEGRVSEHLEKEYSIKSPEEYARIHDRAVDDEVVIVDNLKSDKTMSAESELKVHQMINEGKTLMTDDEYYSKLSLLHEELSALDRINLYEDQLNADKVVKGMAPDIDSEIISENDLKEDIEKDLKSQGVEESLKDSPLEDVKERTQRNIEALREELSSENLVRTYGLANEEGEITITMEELSNNAIHSESGVEIKDSSLKESLSIPEEVMGEYLRVEIDYPSNVDIHLKSEMQGFDHVAERAFLENKITEKAVDFGISSESNEEQRMEFAEKSLWAIPLDESPSLLNSVLKEDERMIENLVNDGRNREYDIELSLDTIVHQTNEDIQEEWAAIIDKVAQVHDLDAQADILRFYAVREDALYAESIMPHLEVFLSDEVSELPYEERIKYSLPEIYETQIKNKQFMPHHIDYDMTSVFIEEVYDEVKIASLEFEAAREIERLNELKVEKQVDILEEEMEL